jgi:hypothetical protein
MSHCEVNEAVQILAGSGAECRSPHGVSRRPQRPAFAGLRAARSRPGVGVSRAALNTASDAVPTTRAGRNGTEPFNG